MSLDFLRDSPDVAFRQTISDLRTMNPKFDPGIFECMTITQIDQLLERLQLRERRIIDESAYGAWLQDPSFIQIKMLQDGLTNLREHIEVLEDTEVLVKGFTYYNDVQQFGTRVQGQQCTYLGEGRPSNWINFIDCAPIMKALELIQHGDTTNDFRRIYVEIANGRADGLQNISVEHITESTDTALRAMEAYCDARWEGPWPWETQAPYLIYRKIEEHRQMRQQTLVEMHQVLNRMLREFSEGGQEHFDIQSTINTMSETVDAMIEKFAKLAGDALINLKAMALTKLGDEAAMKVEHGLTQSVNAAADGLARLKVDIDSLSTDLQNHQETDFNGMDGQDMGMGGQDMGMGTPDAMGGADMGGDMGGAPGAEMAGAPGAGMPANDNQPQMGPAANAAMPAAGMEPERARKKA